MASFNVDYDATSWVLVPFEFPTPAGDSVQQWTAARAQEQRARGYQETRRTGKLDDYFRKLVVGAQSATAQVAHDTIWGLIDQSAPGFIMAALDMSEAEGRLSEYVDAVAARRDDEYEPATVTPIELPNLGQGARIVRYDFDEKREVCVSVGFVFRVETVDFLLSSQTYDLPAMQWVMPLFEELLRGVHITVD